MYFVPWMLRTINIKTRVPEPVLPARGIVIPEEQMNIAVILTWSLALPKTRDLVCPW